MAFILDVLNVFVQSQPLMIATIG